MSLPGWNDLEAVKRISSGIADTTVLFWVLMVLFESSALIWTRRQKLLAGIGFAALVFAVAGEVVGRKYEHRKEALYEEHEAGTARQLNSKIDEANAKAQYAQTLNDAAEKKAAAAKRAAEDAQAQADAMRKQQAPRTLTKEQQQKLVAYLSRCSPGKFEINASVSEEDARPYAEQIALVFRNKGWDVKINNSMFTGPDISGLWLTIQNPQKAPQAVVDINNTLTAAGISNRVLYDVTFTDPTLVTLSIGFKPKTAH